MATKAQLAQYCADHPVIHNVPLFHGVSTLTELIVGSIAVVIAFTLGWYIRGRGMTGVQIDLNNIKTDVLNLKNKIDPSAPAPISATPAPLV
jgi:hypothetical protein